MVGQNPQCLLLLQAQLARDFVNHTQRPQGIAVRRDERCPGVETDLRFGSYEGVIGKPLIQGCVRNNEQAGLREWFRFGGFSDRFSIRPELIGQAANKARELAGEAASVCVVGDTPRDIAAARANSLPVISVATGHYSFDELLDHRPEVCASSLADLLALTQGAQ